MLRNLVLPLCAALLLTETAWADPAATDGALAPGRPAGVGQAQLSNPNTMTFIGLSVLVIGVGIYLAKSTYKIPGQSNQTSSPTGTSP